MQKLSFISLLTLIIGLSFDSCVIRERSTHTDVISDWIGREIVIPDELVYQIKEDTVALDLSRPDFKIVSYVDSTGCTSCRMKLHYWSELIDELKSIPDVYVEVIMVINSDDIKGITELLQRDNYLNPVVIDCDNLFDNLNELPPRSDHHTFLLDTENKVIAIGNPVLNPKIKDVFLQHILLLNDSPYNYDNRNYTVQSIGAIKTGNAIEQTFYLINVDTVSSSVQAIIPSCECISATADFNKISFGKRGKINVTYVADTLPGYFNRYVDLFFNEKELPERLIVYGYIK